MFRRVLNLLLAALILVSPGQYAAHAHHGDDLAEPNDHAMRPHFHLGNHGHHHTDHGEECHGHHSRDKHWDGCNRCNDCANACLLVDPSFSDHDSSAVFIPAGVTRIRDGGVVRLPSITDFAPLAIQPLPQQHNEWQLRSVSPRGEPPSSLDWSCPLYLRTLSLRI